MAKQDKMKRTTSDRARRPGRRRASPPISLLNLFPNFRRAAYREFAKAQQEQFVADLRETYLHRGLVLYLGAGVSRSIGMPDWMELIRALTVTMMSKKVATAIAALKALNDEQQWKILAGMQADVEKHTDYDKPLLMMARAIKDDRLGKSGARGVRRPGRSQLQLRRHS